MVLKKKINILMISSSSSLGGGTKQMFMLGNYLMNDFKIFYAIPENNNFNNYLIPENHIKISERNLNFIDIINLKNFVNFHSIDIIHAHGKGAGAIARIVKLFNNKPLIYTFHGIHLKCHVWYKRIFYKIYEYIFGRIDSTKILVSKSEKDYAKQTKIFLGKNSIIINNGVFNMPIKGSDNAHRLYREIFEISKINVIAINRFVIQKNIGEILNIASYLPNINFYIIGDGPLWKKINYLVIKRKISNVNLLGEKKNIYKYLYSSDIYLSTSLYEGLPLSILEAMSIGLPIVASNVIGNCDTIENGISGFLYELNDINKAIDYLNKLAKSKDLRTKLGFSAYKRQKDLFSKDLMIQKYTNLYKNIL